MKEGDIVTISPNLEDWETAHKSYPFGINEYMLKLRGQRAKITSIDTDYYTLSNYPDYPNVDGKLYRIDLDNGRWFWANIMFEQATNFLKVVEEELEL